MYPIIEVPAGSAQSTEHLGTKPKFWFRDSESVWAICKLARPNTGENWSEKVAAEIAGLLGLPHAHYDLGVFEGNDCIVSPRCFPDDCALIHGNELLGQVDPGYGVVNRYRATAHTLDIVWSALEKVRCDLPIGWPRLPGIHSPADVFVGYLLLDALIGNTDRHHQNWGIVEAPDELAPRRRRISNRRYYLADQAPGPPTRANRRHSEFPAAASVFRKITRFRTPGSIAQ